MKIRSGFVSNSSSSSFVIFGVEICEDNYESLCRQFLPEDKLNESIKEYNSVGDVDWEDMWYSEDVAEYSDLDVIHGDGEIWIGKEIASGGDYMENGSLSLEEMKEYEKEIKEVIPDAECKLYFGTYPC